MAKRDPSAGSVTELGGEGVWMIGDVREREKRSVEEMLPYQQTNLTPKSCF